MKIKLTLITAVFLTVLLISCSKGREKHSFEVIDGIEFHKNSGVPGGDYKPSARFLFEISGPQNVPDSMKGFGEIAQVITDFNENIYVLDGKHAVIKKYTSSGDFDKYFPEQSGIDVSQFKAPTQFAAMYDTLLIYDPGSNKLVRYLSGGQFINSQFLMSGFKPVYLMSDSKTNLSSFVWKRAVIDSVDYMTNDLCLLNDRFKVSGVIKEIRFPVRALSAPDLFTTYALRDGMFYVAENKGSDYRIYAINSRSNIKQVIEKDFKPVSYNEYEISALNNFLKNVGFDTLDTRINHYKKAINSIHVDKKNKLWVNAPADRTLENQDSLYVDIFEKGAFLNTTVLSFIKPDETFNLLGNRIYVITEDRKSIRVYDYE
ncbi:MAG: hypothetical protein RBS89_05580 [Candidatus Delongbacteria bacterium]|jgi:hypothetical protein|nr:hypothetical protein [Candidatus Delongbacteria bacterium]